jgi:hypothetical protein
MRFASSTLIAIESTQEQYRTMTIHKEPRPLIWCIDIVQVHNLGSLALSKQGVLAPVQQGCCGNPLVVNLSLQDHLQSHSTGLRISDISSF